MGLNKTGFQIPPFTPCLVISDQIHKPLTSGYGKNNTTGLLCQSNQLPASIESLGPPSLPRLSPRLKMLPTPELN